jgi:serine/threonine protein kinase
MNLLDRFREHRAMNLHGIPREELLGYLEQAAEALDALFNNDRMQHLDVKPDSLLLEDGKVLLASFDAFDSGDSNTVLYVDGLEGSVAGGVTPVYAAPEACEGTVTRYCDQYSLAIVYQEMLTGARPFHGRNIHEVVMQRIMGSPDLSSLPEHDRPVVARALAKNPTERFPSCCEFVRALREAGKEKD